MKKLTKLLCLLLALAMLASFVGCSQGSGDELLTDDGAALEFNQTFYDEPKLEDTSGVWDYLIDALKLSGKTLISTTISSLVQSGISSLLTELGYDTRSIEQQKLDQIDAKLTELQNTVKEGFQNVLRKQVQIRNEEAMNRLLDKVAEVKDPTMVLLNTLNDLAKKELSGAYSDEDLQRQRLTFAKDCDSLRFNTLSANTVWYSTSLFASAILSPYPANSSLGLWDLYEDTFGALETWDYMTVQPRTEFICYLAFLVNGLAQLSKIAADYRLSLLPEGDSNRLTITNGIKNMADDVNVLNEKFQDELKKLDEIQEAHDNKHIITHRDRNVDSQGNLVITDGVSLSTRLMPVNVGNSDYNYITYDHDEGATFIKDGSGIGQGGHYSHFVYALTCKDQFMMYEMIYDEYRAYAASIGYAGKYTEFTIKDYLATVGFTCRESEKEYFNKTEGFYVHTLKTEKSTDLSNSSISLTTVLYDFKTQFISMWDFSSVLIYRKWSDPGNPKYTRYYSMGHWYLCFLDPDQKTLLGDITTVEYAISSAQTIKMSDVLWKGRKSWSKDMGTKVTLMSEHQ